MRRFTVNPGNLKTRVSIVRTIKEPNEDNILIAKDTILYTTKGLVKTIKPKKFGDNNTYFYEMERVVLIRKHPRHELKEDDRIQIKGVTYDIVFINNELEEDRYLQIQIRECNDRVSSKKQWL